LIFGEKWARRLRLGAGIVSVDPATRVRADAGVVVVTAAESAALGREISMVLRGGAVTPAQGARTAVGVRRPCLVVGDHGPQPAQRYTGVDGQGVVWG
jgi:hypothetical protein